MPNKRLVVVSGPSGVGKGLIIEWLLKIYYPNLYKKLHPEENISFNPEIYNSRNVKKLGIVKVRKTKTERHKENEDNLGFDGCNGNYYSLNCRGTEQRIYLDELDEAIENNDAVLLETYYKAFDFLKNRYENSIDFASTFISPLNAEETKEITEQGKRIEDYLPDLMLDSLIKRAERDGKAFTRTLTRELEKRAEDSVNEIEFAQKNYRQTLPNHCYESDSRWRFPFLIGEPIKVVKSLFEIVETGYSDYAEHRGKDLLG